MTEQYAGLESALERVVTAMRGHLEAVRGAVGHTDDEAVWRAYVELNNVSAEYDELLHATFGEVTPWDVEVIDAEQAERAFGVGADRVADADPDPHPAVVSVRQRRDYRVPSVAALLGLATAARQAMSAPSGQARPAVSSVGEAFVELMQAGDGSLGALDLPELEPLDGIVVVAEVGVALDPSGYPDTDGTGPFVIDGEDRLIDRLDEHACVGVAADEAAGVDPMGPSGCHGHGTTG